MRTPFVVIAALIVALLGLDAALGGQSSTEPRAGAAAGPVAPVDVIARRVETLRGQRFSSVPRPERVTADTARREGLEDFDRSYPRARRTVDEELLKLLGLVPPELTLREAAASLFGEGVAGYYDPRTRRLRTVSGAATGTRVLAETVLAHELNHALEDQRFPLLAKVSESGPGADADAALARLSLVEGTATEVMQQYMGRYFTAEEALVGTLAGAFADTGSMPAFLQAQTVFPYLGGREFVAELLRRAGGRWALVDTAERLRPPVSTEQVLHPERYFRVDEPRAVRMAVGGALGRGWTRAGAGTWGELQTRELLADSGGGGSAEAAAGWGGDRWELWRSRPLEGSGCASPCRAADVLVMRWVWDTPRDAREFAARLGEWVTDRAEEVPGVATSSRGGAVTLVLAPDAATARRVAGAA
jgi:hypothetical protein